MARVGRDAQVLRHGQPISVHDLTTSDVIRATGDYDGDDFKASRVVVLESYPPD